MLALNQVITNNTLNMIPTHIDIFISKTPRLARKTNYRWLPA